MALKHEFNRHTDADERNPILRLDAFLTRATDRAAEGWQARTPFSRQGLTLGLYIAAAILGIAYALVTREVLFLLIGLGAYLGSLPARQRGSLVEEMQMEVTGLPRHTLKYVAVGLMFSGLFGLATSVPFVLAAPLLGGVTLSVLAGMLGGTALTVFAIAYYIARTNPSGQDGTRERQIERVSGRVAAPMAG